MIINHLIHIIETGKLPNLEMLNLDRNNLGGMENEISRLLNTAISLPPEGAGDKSSRSLFSKRQGRDVQTQCTGRTVKCSFSKVKLDGRYRPHRRSIFYGE